jgi:hypothetical protein
MTSIIQLPRLQRAASDDTALNIVDIGSFTLGSSQLPREDFTTCIDGRVRRHGSRARRTGVAMHVSG